MQAFLHEGAEGRQRLSLLLANEEVLDVVVRQGDKVVCDLFLPGFGRARFVRIVNAPLVRELADRLTQKIEPLTRKGGNEDRLGPAVGMTHDLGFESRIVDFVVDEDRGDVVRLDLLEHRVNLADLVLSDRRGGVDHVKQKIRMDRFVKGGLEGLDELMRKAPDEAHSVARDDRLLVADPTAAGGGVERCEQLVGRVALGAREAVEERRLTCVRVAHERNGERVGAGARAALRVTLTRETLELVAKLLHAHADHSAVKLDLLFAGAAGLAEAAALALQMSPAAHEARGEMLELGEFDLQAAFAGLRAGAEDVENQLGAVKNGKLDGALYVSLLGRREGDVEDDDVGMQLMSELSELVNLARADEEGGIGLVALGIKKSDGFESVGLDEKRKLFGRVLVDDAADDDAIG